jgi:FrmR/RcnR family transcriptional regulator, repressor of frmRAB operon
MAIPHSHEHRRKLTHRINRIHGQVEGIRRLMETDHLECGLILQAIAACRGALNGLMAELVAHHLEEHILDLDQTTPDSREEAVTELLQVVRSYLK